MPAISEKLKFESANSRTVRLWPEGTFYKVYERSAYLFVSRLRPYEVKRRYVDKVSGDVGCARAGDAGGRAPTEPAAAAASVPASIETVVADRIRQLDLAAATPLDCMVMLSELKRLLVWGYDRQETAEWYHYVHIVKRGQHVKLVARAAWHRLTVPRPADKSDLWHTDTNKKRHRGAKKI